MGFFVLSVFLLSVTPGPDIAYVVGQSVVNGRRAGIISAAGVALGSCTHAIASAVGLTALITASPMMFTIIKSLGAAYLVYLGSKMIWGTLTKQTTNHNEAERVKAKATLTSLLTKVHNYLNHPKVLLILHLLFPSIRCAWKRAPDSFFSTPGNDLRIDRFYD